MGIKSTRDTILKAWKNLPKNIKSTPKSKGTISSEFKLTRRTKANLKERNYQVRKAKAELKEVQDKYKFWWKHRGHPTTKIAKPDIGAAEHKYKTRMKEIEDITEGLRRKGEYVRPSKYRTVKPKLEKIPK